MSRNACENRRNGNDFHSGHRKQNSRLLNEVQQCTPQWGVQATERSCVSKMEGLRPDKFAFALATNTPAGCLSDRTFLRKQNGGVSLRQVRVCASNKHPCGVFQFVKEPHHQAAQQPSAASKIQKYFPKACKQRRFHAQFASFFRFKAANLSLTHCVTRARPLMWV